ncbi:MAG: hypothetical protein HYW27_01960 [Candidatus Aenigmarchaeota archaeon]|nr:hypothetical protein [Candidatus Aenigmarchaeota archaeon]
MGMNEYVSRAKDAVLDWAAEHNDFLQRWGERTKYAGVGVGAASFAAMKYAGIEDPGTLSRYMVTPAAVVFAAGEGMKVLGEYSLDRERGETDPVKNAGYVARIMAPLYAIPYGADGVWEGGHDVAVPVVAWAGGAGLTKAGEKRVHEKKLDAAIRTYREFYRRFGDDADRHMIGKARRYNPDALIETVARNVPLKDLK